MEKYNMKLMDVTRSIYGMMKLMTPLMLLVITACSGTPAPYFEVGIGWNIDEMTDYWLKTEQSWTCDNNDTFHAELGLEWDNNVQLGYHHQSHVSCGGPFNDKPEVYQDEIILTKKWGGL
jgi:hypothetical protein